MGDSPTVLLRRAQPEELDTIGEVTVAAYADFTTGDDDGYLTHLRDARARDRDAELWVAVSGDGEATEVLGSVTICLEGSPWREIAEPGEGEFRMLSVAPTARGRGVGRALVELALERFRAAGATAVVLSSLAEMSIAHRLYERLGFSRLPDRDWRPGPEIHLLAFRKELS